jgi:hypothetical protein
MTKFPNYLPQMVHNTFLKYELDGDDIFLQKIFNLFSSTGASHSCHLNSTADFAEWNLYDITLLLVALSSGRYSFQDPPDNFCSGIYKLSV